MPPAAATPANSPVVLPAHTHASALRQRLQQEPGVLLVACYCAAWCQTCAAYRRDFETLAQRYTQHVFAWIDVEESPQLLQEEDVENFPTLLLQQGERTLFFGVQQPIITHLEGLLARSDRLAPAPQRPPLRALLQAHRPEVHCGVATEPPPAEQGRRKVF